MKYNSEDCDSINLIALFARIALLPKDLFYFN